MSRLGRTGRSDAYHDEIADDVGGPGDGTGAGEGLVGYGGARGMDGGPDGEGKERRVDRFREEVKSVRDGPEHHHGG